MTRPVVDKTVVHTSAAGKTLPPGTDYAATVAQWPRWSLGIRVANFLFVSGTGGQGPDGRIHHDDDPRRQATLAMQRLLAVVEAGGGGAEDLITVRVYLDQSADREAVIAGIGDFLALHLSGAYPAFSIVVANTSDPSVHAEIEAFAATSHESVRVPAVPVPFAAEGRRTTPAGWADYSHAVRVGNLWFLSALLPIDADGCVEVGSVAAQADRVLAHLDTVLDSVGRAAADLVRLTVWVGESAAVDAVQAAVDRYLVGAFGPHDGPALTLLVAPLLANGAVVQIEAVAARGGRRTVRGVAPGRPARVAAVAVPIGDEVESFVRRFTWPEPRPSDVPVTAPAHRSLGEIVFLSAQTGTGPDGELVAGSMGPQARQTLDNMRAIVEAAGGQFDDIVQFGVFYADRSLYADYNAERIVYLEQHNPGSSWFAGSGPKALSALPGALVEMESIAVLQWGS